jgi:hypothetical protein
LATTLARGLSDEAVTRLRELGGTPVTVDFAPLAQAAEPAL